MYLYKCVSLENINTIDLYVQETYMCVTTYFSLKLEGRFAPTAA